MRTAAVRPFILVSACLVGCRSRYDAAVTAFRDDRLEQWLADGLVLPFCPETAGGLPVPRPPSEIANGAGPEVLAGDAQVLTCTGADVTANFVDGARLALAAVRHLGIGAALFKEGSPSCGTSRIYDGSFRGRRVPGRGVTAALLADHGVTLFNEDNLAHLADWLSKVV